MIRAGLRTCPFSMGSLVRCDDWRRIDMSDWIVMLGLGVLLIVLGISNRKGNISSLHRYHRKRVSEEDRIPFGKLVGTGTIIIGIALMVSGVLSYLSVRCEQEMFILIGNIVTGAGLVVGLGLNFYAMFKYNKGIF